MSVEDWARWSADIDFPNAQEEERAHIHFSAGSRWAFDALLSDEAVRGASVGYWKASMEDLAVDEEPTAEELEQFVWAIRIVLQSAVDAVMKGDARE